MKNGSLSAFPLYSESNGPEWGMTKREYFAAAALQGLLANPTCVYHTAHESAIIKADALLEELEKSQE